jgi:quercetin dioxygenase-like cupin family protein
LPIDVRRFGVGHRRPDGPPGTVGIEGQVIESGRSGVIAELAFGRRARITPHTNPNQTWFIVIEGGGWVGVGDARTRVTAGEAVEWPPDILHAAWTEGSPMRAIVVEFLPPSIALPATVAGLAVEIEPGPPKGRPAARGEGGLAPWRRDPLEPTGEEPAEGEPI